MADDIQTTSIDNLPAQHHAVTMSIQEQPPVHQNNTPMTLDQSTISQIVSGIQQASYTGATQLPSRDIPMDTTQITHDNTVRPNYIPQNGQYVINDDQYGRKYVPQSNDNTMKEYQIPLLIGIMYFIFQLPVFKLNILKLFPSLFSEDNNYNMNGLTFVSVMFAIAYYFITTKILIAI